MAQSLWLVIGLISLVVIPTEMVFGLALCFSPGWANGWPGGLPIQPVWAAGLSLLLFLFLMTVAAGAGALVLAFSSLRQLVERSKLRVFLTYIMLAAIALAPFAIIAFLSLHSAAMEMWPNGYNP
jgi:hypothetical protein